MKQFKCGACNRGFKSLDGATEHVRKVHAKSPKTGVYKLVDTITPEYDDEPSFADRARQAELDIAMGVPTDDGWLLP